MANLADFRGAGEPDSRTAFEIGFATAVQTGLCRYGRHRAADHTRAATAWRAWPGRMRARLRD
ncbi:hypothetical protein K6W55_18730 [Burkholderia dolosa]|nr:hypothetical protein [Burkholderia dolosa]